LAPLPCNWLAASPLDYDLPIVVAVVMPVIVVTVTVTAHDDGPVAVAVVFSMGPDDLSVAVPVAFTDPHVQFLRKRRRRNNDGRTGGHKKNNFAHFQTPQLVCFRSTIRCAQYCSVISCGTTPIPPAFVLPSIGRLSRNSIRSRYRLPVSRQSLLQLPGALTLRSGEQPASRS
jgi:hypothetical protein